MIRYIELLILLLLVNISLIRGDCYECIGLNKKAPIDSYDSVLCTNMDFSTYLNSTSNSCKLLPNLGEACVEYNGCLEGNLCVDNICTNYYSVDIGGKCKVDQQCIGRNCTNGVCVVTTICQYDFQCKWNQFCNDEVCEPLRDEGETCFTDFSCDHGLNCINEKCAKKFSVQNGQACSLVDDCNFSKGLYCDSNTCKKFVPTPSSTKCNSTSCQRYEYCDCVTNSCKQQRDFNAAAQTAYQKYFSCTTKNQCNLNSRFSPTSCVITNCGAEYCSTLLHGNPDEDVVCYDATLIPFCKKFLDESSEASGSIQLKISILSLIVSFILSLYI